LSQKIKTILNIYTYSNSIEKRTISFFLIEWSIKEKTTCDGVSIGVYQLLAHRVAFWILMDQSSFWVELLLYPVVLEVVECLSNNVIRFRPLLGGVSFDLFIDVSHICGHLLFRSLSFTGRCPSCTETWF
jgi:hypothetical protein